MWPHRAAVSQSESQRDSVNYRVCMHLATSIKDPLYIHYNTQFCLCCYKGYYRGDISSCSLEDSRSSNRIEVECNPLSSNVILKCPTACGDSSSPSSPNTAQQARPMQVVHAPFHFKWGVGGEPWLEVQYYHHAINFLGLPKRNTAGFPVYQLKPTLPWLSYLSSAL